MFFFSILRLPSAVSTAATAFMAGAAVSVTPTTQAGSRGKPNEGFDFSTYVRCLKMLVVFSHAAYLSSKGHAIMDNSTLLCHLEHLWIMSLVLEFIDNTQIFYFL